MRRSVLLLVAGAGDKLSPERRREIAKKAAEARWARKRQQEEESS
jgi:hypothetical protein